MEGFAKAKNANAVAFLDSLSTPQRQALWQRFSAARNALKDENADQLWSDLAKGKGSDPHKKALLQCFLKLGGDLKSKKEVYMKELVSYCKVHGHTSSEEWVPFATVLKHYGLAEAMRRVHRGTILCRKDPEDECEWQFCLKKKLEWTKEETRHEQKGDSSAKLECAQWLELKAKSLMPGEMGDANQAKLALAEVTGKGLPALMDKERGSAAGSEQDQDNAVVEADLLSDMGGKLVKEDAKTRLNRMVKLLQTVKGEVGAEKGKPLDKALTDLKKLLKQGGKMTMDQAKQHLFDAALEIKKVKKAK
ncbi:unnamed protein product [Durusdinium trenchii]|uniref:Uncharacterized protein n=1 Tax=Durusdinium trenchii TaxID=1381693 RepID=A0ABP0KLD8_9DINO